MGNQLDGQEESETIDDKMRDGGILGTNRGYILTLDMCRQNVSKRLRGEENKMGRERIKKFNEISNSWQSRGGWM